MATMVAKGPLRLLLQTSSGQYLFLGLGAYALFPEQVQKLLAPLLKYQPDLLSSLGDRGENDRNSNNNSMQPIIIQTPPTTIINGDGRKGSLVREVVTYAVVGAGACWVGYVVCTQFLPDAVVEYMPVTKKLFRDTAQTLANGILNIKEALEEKIKGLYEKQDELSCKQDETNEQVREIGKELNEARIDLIDMQSSLERCELSLHNTQNMQGYTLRGIKLLVRCVTSFLPDDSAFAHDIDRFMHEGGDRPGGLLSSGGGSNNGDTGSSKVTTPSGNAGKPLPQSQVTPPLSTPSSMLTPNRGLFTPSPARRSSSYDDATSSIRALLGH